MAIQHFHYFLYGAKFTIFTDHKPLMWLILLTMYQFEIKYKPGKENVAADSLSRMLEDNAINLNPDNEYLDV
jgi:hypothetical protein